MRLSRLELDLLTAGPCEAHGISQGIAYGCIYVESGGDPRASRTELDGRVSRGLLQIMEETARDMGWRGVDPEELFDPGLNVDLGVRYLAWCRSKFPEVLLLDLDKFAVGAYNAGRGNINAALRRARAELLCPEGEPGLWQSWEFSSAFLHQQGLLVTVPHVAKVCAARDRWRRATAGG